MRGGAWCGHYGVLGADAPRAGEKPLLCALAQEIGPHLAKYPYNARCDSRSRQDTPTLYAKWRDIAVVARKVVVSCQAGAFFLRERALWSNFASAGSGEGCGDAAQGWIRQGESRQHQIRRAERAAVDTVAASAGTYTARTLLLMSKLEIGQRKRPSRGLGLWVVTF